MRIKVFTAFSGYDSQLLALQRAGIDFDCVGWSEVDKYAIQAHNVLFPDLVNKNYGDISQIDWSVVPDFDLFTYSSPCQDFSLAGLQRGGARRKWYAFKSAMGMSKGYYCQTTKILTPSECFRLMGLTEQQISLLLQSGISNTQLYKMAGNSIVVNVLEAIFKQLLIKNNNVNQQLKLF